MKHKNEMTAFVLPVFLTAAFILLSNQIVAQVVPVRHRHYRINRFEGYVSARAFQFDNISWKVNTLKGRYENEPSISN